jgi:hypothetical protein
MSSDINILAAWVSILCGVGMGAAMGVVFDREKWLGGYGSWARRMLRLGHISFFGIGFINLGYAATVKYLEWSQPPEMCSRSLVYACALMPAICFAAAIDRRWRHAFAAPVACVLCGVVGILIGRIL